MFTSFDKAIAAALGAALYFMSEFAGINLGLSEEAFQGLATLVSTLAVYRIPNKGFEKVG